MPSDTFTLEPDFPFHLKAQRLAEELASAQKKLREYEDLCTCCINDISYWPIHVPLDFASHLRAQRAAEESTGAQKKLREYEDLCRRQTLNSSAVLTSS
jgi:hypothetical protein